MTHRTGLPRHDRVWYRAGQTRREIVEAAAAPGAEPRLPPTWQYNNLMFVTAGVVAERVSGQSWEAFTRERIFRPLGMTATGSRSPTPQKTDDFARPYGR